MQIVTEEFMISKEYTKTGRSCRVTFTLPADVNAQSAALLAESNAWAAGATPAKRRKDGPFSVAVSLKPGQQYRFRYLLDGERWENDGQADGYAPNEFGAEDSVLQV
jgi:1,4-alpha-glucan branching enzyme